MARFLTILIFGIALLATSALAQGSGPKAPPSKKKQDDPKPAKADDGEENNGEGDATEEGSGGDPAKPKGDEPKGGEKPAAEEGPKEPPAWTLDARDRKKLDGLLGTYLIPGRKARPDLLAKIEKFLGGKFDGHSPMEDVGAWVDAAASNRLFGSKLGSRKGKVQEVSVGPDVHGFPGGIGTVKYWLRLPKKYKDSTLWPVLFCLPDNKVHNDGKKYIEQLWAKRSEQLAEEFILVAPVPQAKGDDWTRPKSMARAMIALRHVMGTYDADKKTAGPASDLLRVFVAGGDAAALVAARYPEMFGGAVLFDATGRVSGYDLNAAGQLSGMAAYCVCKAKRAKTFAATIKDANAASAIEESADGAGDPAAITKWLSEIPVRNHQPRNLTFAVHDPSFQRHYWVNVLEYDASIEPAPEFEATADRSANEITIRSNGVTRLEVFVNDAIVDLNRKLKIVVVDGEKKLEFLNDKAERSLGKMLDELLTSNHPWRVYPARFVIDVPALREAVAAKEAAEAEKVAAAKKDETQSAPKPIRPLSADG